MREEIQQYLAANKELQRFIREQPYWYRRLSREPDSLEQFEIASLHYFKKTIPHHVERFSNSLHMAQMMIGLFQTMKNT